MLSASARYQRDTTVMIVVWSIKGGSGKSIIATNLSILPAKAERFYWSMPTYTSIKLEG
jgi:hypothetical protein